MPISGLVITLSDDPSQRQIALDQLATDPRLTLGQLHGSRLPVVAETETVRQSTDLVREELLDIPGVVFVDIVSVDFSDIDESAEPEEREQKRPRETRENN